MPVLLLQVWIRWSIRHQNLDPQTLPKQPVDKTKLSGVYCWPLQGRTLSYKYLAVSQNRKGETLFGTGSLIYDGSFKGKGWGMGFIRIG